MKIPLFLSKKTIGRRNFIHKLFLYFIALLIPAFLKADEKKGKKIDWILDENYNPTEHYWGMGIDINKCIGCGRCVNACPVKIDMREVITNIQERGEQIVNTTA